MSKRPKVLIISYLFPPIAGGGVPRPLKFCKYLPQYGWDPVVLTVDPKYHVSKDESLLQQVPEGTPVYRAKEWNPYDRLNKLRVSRNHAAPARKEAAGGGTPEKSSLSSRIKKQIFAAIKKAKNYVLIPDDQVLWVPMAIREGLKAIREQQVDVIFSTSGPYSCHLVGFWLAKKTGLPWVADYRDPWTQNMHRPGIPFREKIEEWMERNVMEKATVVTTVTRTFAEQFRQKYPNIRRLELIHNGYDPEDYVDIPVRKIPGKLVFAYTGIFYKERHPRHFLQALAELIREGKVDRNEVLVRFAGVFDYPGYTENQDAVERLGLSDLVEVLGYLPHRESLSLLKSSDVLLLIGDTAPGSEAYIPGKLYEYMAVQRPILSLSVPGESSQIVTRFRIGKVVDPQDPEAIKAAILQFYQAWKENRLDQTFSYELDPEQLSIYRRDKQAELLSRILDECRKRD